MDDEHLDRVARFLAGFTDRRNALKTLAAGSLGGATLSQFGLSPSAAQDGPLEEWVQLYEELAVAVDSVTGDCTAVVEAMRSFHDEHLDNLARMEAELENLSSDDVALHRGAHGNRVQQAAITIHLALTRCGYLPGSDSPFSVADIQAFTDQATPAAFAPANLKAVPLPVAQATPVLLDECDGVPPDQMCECLCDKSFTVGNCIAWAFGCAFGGCAAAANCCWEGICVAGYDHQQCVAQCGNCENIQICG